MRFIRVMFLIAVTAVAFSARAGTVDRARHKSPDGRFAIRVDVEPGTANSEEVDANEVIGIRLVAVASGKTVATLLPEDIVGTNYSGVRLVWSSDSQWCAFYYSHPRVGYLHVFHRVGSKFVEVPGTDDLRVGVERWMGVKGASARNEYRKPLRWLEPGRLLIEQWSIVRIPDGEPDDLTLRLTAQYRKGRFRVVDVKDAPPTRALP
jgi:hypothetical protein